MISYDLENFNREKVFLYAVVSYPVSEIAGKMTEKWQMRRLKNVIVKQL